MQSKNNQPNAEQLRWRELVREQGCIITGQPAEVHHVYGCSFKHNKIHVGHWFILPLSFDLHDLMGKSSHNITRSRMAFTRHYGLQKELFESLVTRIRIKGHEIPFDDDVMQAIMDLPR